MMNTATAIQTPWGQSQGVDVIAPGIEFVSTASHGGIRLSGQRNNQNPMWLKQLTFNEQGKTGWYEEDCDWCIPVIVFSREAGRWARNQGRHDLLDEAYRFFRRYHLPKVDVPEIGGGQVESSGLYLGLYHGRDSVDKSMDDWGSRGPLIGPLRSFTVTYMADIRLAFENHLDALKYGFRVDQAELIVKEDCIEYREIFYGDWQVSMYE